MLMALQPNTALSIRQRSQGLEGTRRQERVK